jgi:hypothetical protein
MSNWLPAVTRLVCLCVWMQLTAVPASAQPGATVIDRGTHYEAVLDYEAGGSRRDVARQYGAAILRANPDYEKLIDSYIADNTGHWLIYKIVLGRANKIRPFVPVEYREEIEGIASSFSGGEKNVMGDGKLSVDELYTFNLLGDIGRMNQCSAVAVFGDSSADGHTLVGRNFDFPDGKDHQLARIACVTTVKDGSRSMVMMSCLGFQAAITAFNKYGVFASVLDSPTGAKYTASKRRSYTMDMRKALEGSWTLHQVADQLKDPQKQYAYNHLVFLADRAGAAVLENNISGRVSTRSRELRLCTSALRQGVVWDVPSSIAAVNCFQLSGNDDNHIDPLDLKQTKKNEAPPEINTPRWESIREQLKLHGPKVTSNGIKEIISFFHNDSRGNIYKGDVYNGFTLQNVVFDPNAMLLEIAFRPRDGKMPWRPKFENIPVSFADGIMRE